jgi:hypothetical protein
MIMPHCDWAKWGEEQCTLSLTSDCVDMGPTREFCDAGCQVPPE